MLKIPIRSFQYAVLATAHIIFALTFPFYSGDFARLMYRWNMMETVIIIFSIPFFAGMVYFSVTRWHSFKTERKLILGFAILAYCAVYFSLPDHKERLHIISFSLMAVLIYKVFSPMTRLRWAGLAGFTLTSVTCTVDEWIQIYIPDRTSNLHDVMLGVKGAMLGVLMAWLFDAYSRKGRQAHSSHRPPPVS